ncbi:MAG: cytochrome P460 family protein [Desulfobacula sp.]|nr:cytochrome P460 family protein [Desulfobacula sp.]
MTHGKKITGFMIFFIAFFIGSSAMAEMPGADPKDLWDHITKNSPYTQWNFWDDHKGMIEGRQPHGSLHKVYVNDRAYNSSKVPLEYGAIQVKENYNMAKELKAITVMYKVKGYNPPDGDWFWVKYSPNGMAKPHGKPTGCIDCHGTRANNDFVIVHDIE